MYFKRDASVPDSHVSLRVSLVFFQSIGLGLLGEVYTDVNDDCECSAVMPVTLCPNSIIAYDV